MSSATSMSVVEKYFQELLAKNEEGFREVIVRLDNMHKRKPTVQELVDYGYDGILLITTNGVIGSCIWYAYRSVQIILLDVCAGEGYKEIGVDQQIMRKAISHIKGSGGSLIEVKDQGLQDLILKCEKGGISFLPDGRIFLWKR